MLKEMTTRISDEWSSRFRVQLQVVSDDPIDFMEQQPAGIAVQGLLRPAFIEEQSVIQKHMSSHTTKIADSKNLKAQKDNSVKDEEFERDNGLTIGTAFYKLEMVKIQLISAGGNKAFIIPDKSICFYPIHGRLRKALAVR